MSNPTEEPLAIDPFPPLKWDKFCWSGSITLAAWSGFQSRLGSYGTVNSKRASDGTAGLNVTTPDNKQVLPSAEQAEAMRHLFGHESDVRDAVLASLLRDYPAMRESYDYDDDEADELMPEVTEAGQFRKLLGLSNVHVLTVAKDGAAYVGLEFGCTWDTEHGLGVMTHRSRVIMVGGADTSFLQWIAREDAESRE